MHTIPLVGFFGLPPTCYSDKSCSRYADHVGIQYALCSKLRQFTYEELEFSLPQLCQLLISVNNESMALEEFIIDLCEESVNASLLVLLLHPLVVTDKLANDSS